MTFSHISQKSAQLTHTEENKKSMKMIGPWRGWSVSEPPKGAYHIVCESSQAYSHGKSYVRRYVSTDEPADWSARDHAKYAAAMECVNTTIAVALQKGVARLYTRLNTRLRQIRAAGG